MTCLRGAMTRLLEAMTCPRDAMTCLLEATTCPREAMTCLLEAMTCLLEAMTCPRGAMTCLLEATTCPRGATTCPRRFEYYGNDNDRTHEVGAGLDMAYQHLQSGSYPLGYQMCHSIRQLLNH
jgi:hypothetical protein